MGYLKIEDINYLIREFGPIMYLHSDEKYLMDDPEEILKSGKVALEYGVLPDEENYNTFSKEYKLLGSFAVPIANALPAVEQEARRIMKRDYPEYQAVRCWLRIPEEFRPGNMSRAKTFVTIRHQDDPADSNQMIVQLQFWFFYPYNGPGKFRVSVGAWTDHKEVDTIGRHTGDWEHVTLELTNDGPWSIRQVYLSRHEWSQWCDASEFQYVGKKPKIYIARDSHAHYQNTGNSSGNHFYRVRREDIKIGTFAVDLYDQTNAKGTSFDTASNFQLVSSDFQGHEEYDGYVSWPKYLNYGGRWGGYEKNSYTYSKAGISLYTQTILDSGPHGPQQSTADLGFAITTGLGATCSFGNPQAFVQKEDKLLAHYNWTGSSWQWTDHEKLPDGEIAGGVDATTMPDGRPLVFVYSTSGQLWRRYFDGTNWQWVSHGTAPGSQSPGNYVVGGVGITTPSGAPNAFVRTQDGRLCHVYWTGKEWQWEDDGKPNGTMDVVGGIGAVTLQGRPLVFVRTSDGRMWQKYWDGNTKHWQWFDHGLPQTGVQVVGRIGVTAGSDRPHVYVRGSDGGAWLCIWTGTQWTWTKQGAPGGATGAGVGAISKSERPHAFMFGSDGFLWTNWSTGRGFEWTQFSRFRFPLIGPVGVTKIVDPRQPVDPSYVGDQPYVFVRNGAGQLCLLWWTGSEWKWQYCGKPGRKNALPLGWSQCKSVIPDEFGKLYAVTPEGDLHWYGFTIRPYAGGVVPPPKVIGSGGWAGFTRVFSGGRGVIYAITPTGELRRYYDPAQDGTAGIPASVTLGRSVWNDFKFVFSGGSGIIYAVTYDGNVWWYRDLTAPGKAGLSAPGLIGRSGWDQFAFVFSGAGGIIYAVTVDGKLRKYKDQTRDGTGDLSSFEVIGNSNWNDFADVVGSTSYADAFGSNIRPIYARTTSGALRLYLDQTGDGPGDVTSFFRLVYPAKQP